MKMISPESDTVVARRGSYGEFRFECWGERNGVRLPDTVMVTDLAELESEVRMAGLTLEGGPAYNVMRRVIGTQWDYSAEVATEISR